MPMKIVVEIDADVDTCGRCRFKVVDTVGCDACSAFPDQDGVMPEVTNVRCLACHAAEKAASALPATTERKPFAPAWEQSNIRNIVVFKRRVLGPADPTLVAPTEDGRWGWRVGLEHGICNTADLCFTACVTQLKSLGYALQEDGE